MEMLLRSPHGEVPQKAREYAGKKLQKIERFFHNIGGIEFVHEELRGKHLVEMTVDADGLYVRSEVSDSDLFSAIDKAVDKLEAQLKRFRGRIVNHHRQRGDKGVPAGFADFEADAPPMDEDHTPRIVEKRMLSAKPMSADEAALQIDLLGRDFMVFRDSATEELCVVYRRQDGDLVLLHG